MGLEPLLTNILQLLQPAVRTLSARRRTYGLATDAGLLPLDRLLDYRAGHDVPGSSLSVWTTAWGIERHLLAWRTVGGSSRML